MMMIAEALKEVICELLLLRIAGQCIFGTNSTESGVCKCRSEYTKPDCSHKRKSQLTAFLLSFFVGGTYVNVFVDLT